MITSKQFAGKTIPGNRKVRMTSVMMVKQRAKNFTYSTTLKLIKFGLDPTTTTMQALRASFKELSVGLEEHCLIFIMIIKYN